MKLIYSIATTLLLCASANAGVNSTCVLSSNEGKTIQERIDEQGVKYSDIKTLVVKTGTVSSEDCKFIKTEMTNLQNIRLEDSADFIGHTVPKGAFEGMVSLRSISSENTIEVGAKAFSLCKNLETVSLPAVKTLQVQAFAQAKGSNDSKLREVRLPNLQKLNPRAFYYCIALENLYLDNPPVPVKPEGKEGLWFERVSKLVIHVPSAAVYKHFIAAENCSSIDWSAFNFVAENGDELPAIKLASEYKDSDYDYLRSGYLPKFDKTGKDWSGEYYRGDFKLSLNLYTFNMNLNAAINESGNTPALSTKDAIIWAAKNGFDAVDVTCYYIPGYSNTALPDKSKKEILKYAREIRTLCKSLGIEVSGSGLQNNFADPNAARRETDIERIKFWLEVASEMGAPVLRIFAGPPPADIRREGWEKITQERIVPCIQEVADYAAEHFPDVRIGVQNHGCMLSTANQVMQLLKWVDRDNVGIINDTGFYRDFMSTDARNYDWYRDIALILPYSNNFQIKKKPAGAETDELMDLIRLLTDIRKSPYRGYLPIELLWISRDKGYPGSLSTPPYEETIQFLELLKEAIEATKNLNVDKLTLQGSKTPAELFDLLGLSKGETLMVTHTSGLPLSWLEPIMTGDVIEVVKGGTEVKYIANVMTKTNTNLALGVPADRIKISSTANDNSPCVAFDGDCAGFSGSGVQFDGSQANSSGKETFWLAADLGAELDINSFGIAWGTSVGQLKKRLKNGTYKVMYTNDPDKWANLSTASAKGKKGYPDYCAPEGWDVAYEQNVSDLVDANGNKLFIKKLGSPLKARYIMVSGELSAGGIEIYDFLAFAEQEIQSFEQFSVPEGGLIARPKYMGMVLAPGRPALMRSGDMAPQVVISSDRTVGVNARIIDESGKTVYNHPTTNIVAGSTTSLKLGYIVNKPGTYKILLEYSGKNSEQEILHFTAIDTDITAYNYANPYQAFDYVDKSFRYYPDYRGGILPDYSLAGYGAGGQAIPSIPVKIVLSPSNLPDDADRIQQAVDMISRMPIQEGQVRGALLLKSGTYMISRPIVIQTSGIVIMGEGDGHDNIRKDEKPIGPSNWFDYSHSHDPEQGVTKVIATWKSNTYDKETALFEFKGKDSRPVSEYLISDRYIPIGSFSFHVQDASGLKPGDDLRISRALSERWAHDLKMDVITEAPDVLSNNQWTSGGKVISNFQGSYQDRRVVAVDYDNNLVTVQEPIVEPIDLNYGAAKAELVDASERISNCGIENIQLISCFDKSETSTNSAYGNVFKSFSDELHAQVGVYVKYADNFWVRRVCTYHVDVAVNVSAGRWMTIQDVNCLDPVGGTGGERRYSFTNSGGSMVLNQRNYANYTRHGFIVMGNVMGPNVFLNDITDWQFDANEPHLKWSTGGLYDNVRGRIYVQNRWNNGTAHGWSGSCYTLFNCEGPFIISQNPLTPNYLMGQYGHSERIPFVMSEVDPGNVPNYKAAEYSVGSRMPMESLYYAQLEARKGPEAVAIAKDNSIPSIIDESKGFLNRFAYLDAILIDGKIIDGFDKYKFDYSVDLPLDSDNLPNITAKAKRGHSITISGMDGETGVIVRVEKNGLYQNSYLVHFNVVSKEPISSPWNKSSLKNLTDGSEKTSWSQSETPYVQFYLGDTPREIEGISLGYCRNTQSRYQYYFEFEVSDDGYNWTKIDKEDWQHDNLGNGHLMGMQLIPGPGNSRSDQEYFSFPDGTKARLVRVRMYGARFGKGKGTKNTNSYWSIEVKTK